MMIAEVMFFLIQKGDISMERTNNKLSPSSELDFTVTQIQVVYEYYNPPKDWKRDWSFFPVSKILFVIDGEASFWIDGKEIKASKNNIYFVPFGSAFHSCSRGVRFHYISVQFFVDNSNPNAMLQTSYKCSNPNHMLNLFRQMNREWERRNAASILKVKSILYDILFEILQEQLTNQNRSEKYYKIQDGLNYMEEHFFDSNLNIEKIAEASGISSVHFRNLFKEIFETSPTKYIIEIRLQKAIDLLMFSDLPVYKISETIGYENVNYFNRIFKKHMLFTPIQYRERTK